MQNTLQPGNVVGIVRTHGGPATENPRSYSQPDRVRRSRFRADVLAGDANGPVPAPATYQAAGLLRFRISRGLSLPFLAQCGSVSHRKTSGRYDQEDSR